MGGRSRQPNPKLKHHRQHERHPSPHSAESVPAAASVPPPIETSNALIVKPTSGEVLSDGAFASSSPSGTGVPQPAFLPFGARGTSSQEIAKDEVQDIGPNTVPALVARLGDGKLLTLVGACKFSWVFTVLIPPAVTFSELWLGRVDFARDGLSSFMLPAVFGAWFLAISTSLSAALGVRALYRWVCQKIAINA